MAGISSIELNDSSPAARFFNPGIKDGLLSTYQEETLAVASLFPRISIGMRKPSGNTPRKVTLKVTVPVEVTEGDVTSYEAVSAFIDFVISNNATQEHILDLVSYVTDLMSEAQVTELVEMGRFPH